MTTIDHSTDAKRPPRTSRAICADLMMRCNMVSAEITVFLSPSTTRRRVFRENPSALRAMAEFAQFVDGACDRQRCTPRRSSFPSR